MTAGSERGIADVRLERYRLGELPRAEMRQIEEALARDGGLQARLAALERSDGELAERYPAHLMAARIRARLDAAGVPAGAGKPAWIRLAPLGAAALLLLVAAAVPVMLREPDLTDVVRIKGAGPSLFLYRRVGDGSERLEPGARARGGDQVRLAYRASGKAHGVILSVDSKGVVTRHLPVQGRQSVPLRPDAIVMLDAAYELDATPGWERFYLVTGDAPFDVEPLIRAAGDAARRGTVASPPALALGPGLDQFVFTLAKDEGE